MIARRIAPLLGVLALVGCDSSVKLVLVPLAAAPETAPAGSTIDLALEAKDGEGNRLRGVDVSATVERGGGSVDPPDAVTAATVGGRPTVVFSWRLGPAPVRNRLRVKAGKASVVAEVRATIDTPFTPQPFGDVNGFMAGEGIEGSTEDLAFAPHGGLMLGVPGGLIGLNPQGEAGTLPLVGDVLEGPLGIVYDREDNLWVADGAGGALRKVTPTGIVSTLRTEGAAGPLVQPNYVAVGPRGSIYLSDPCAGELMRIDPTDGTLDDVLTLDLATQGGPNGFAFAADQKTLYLVTENTVLLCGNKQPEFDDEIAGLFRVPVTEQGFGELQTVAAGVGLFGDGVAFDIEGNLYAIFDKQENLTLSESTVFVLPEGESELLPFVSVSDHVLANLAFGTEDFGATTLYIALLAVPAFTAPEARGVERFEVGIRGLPLLR